MQHAADVAVQQQAIHKDIQKLSNVLDSTASQLRDLTQYLDNERKWVGQRDQAWTESIERRLKQLETSSEVQRQALERSARSAPRQLEHVVQVKEDAIQPPPAPARKAVVPKNGGWNGGDGGDLKGWGTTPTPVVVIACNRPSVAYVFLPCACSPAVPRLLAPTPTPTGRSLPPSAFNN